MADSTPPSRRSRRLWRLLAPVLAGVGVLIAALVAFTVLMVLLHA